MFYVSKLYFVYHFILISLYRAH